MGNSPRDPEEAQIAALQRQIELKRASAAKDEPRVQPACNAVVDALQARYSPSAQKERLVAELRALVNDPVTFDWLYGYAADLMLVHGQSTRQDAEAIYECMQKVLAELREFRELRRRMGQPPAPRGMVFNRRVMEIARNFGIPTPRELRDQRKDARRRSRLVNHTAR